MVTQEQFHLIRRKHGQYASWAVWAAASARATSNVGDMSALDPEANPELLAVLNPAVVMLGLNISRPLLETLSNFHDKRSQALELESRRSSPLEPMLPAWRGRFWIVATTHDLSK
jgi:hypothetical protein